MTEEPAERACPHCEEPVGSRATYCMHCGRDLPDPVEYDDPVAYDETGTVEDADGEALLERVTSRVRSAAVGRGGDSVEDGYDEADDQVNDDWRTDSESADDSTEDDRSLTTDPRVPSPDGSEGPRLLTPTGWLAHSLPVAAAVIGGLLVGVASLSALGVPLQEGGVWLSVLAWLGSTIYVGRRRSVYDAVRYGIYGLAVLMVFVPFGLAISAEGGPSARAVALAVMLVPVGLVALIVTGIGHAAGQGVPE